MIVEGDYVRYRSNRFSMEESTWGQRDRIYEVLETEDRDGAMYTLTDGARTKRVFFTFLEKAEVEPVPKEQEQDIDAAWRLTPEESEASKARFEEFCKNQPGAFIPVPKDYPTQITGVWFNEAESIMSALDEQVGGDHYKKMGIQPVELCFQRHGYAGAKIALSVKVDKYLTREKDDELEQLDKAIHCIEMMKEFYKRENNV